MNKLVLAAMLCTSTAACAQFTGGILVQSETPGAISYRIREYGLDGSVRQTIIPPAPPNSTDLQNPRDLVVGSDGRLSLFNGTFDPYLSTFDPVPNSWSHVTRADWATVNNVSYGGIARYGNNVFVTDMLEGSPAGGVVVFDTGAGTSSEFATSLSPTDLNLGLDGKLWVLSGSVAYAFNPATFAAMGSVNLPGGFDIRGLAVDQNGDFYLATWDGVLAHVGPGGNLLGTRSFGGSLIDVDVSPGGGVLVGTRLDGAWLTDTSLSTPLQIESGRWNSFVSFVPEPGVLYGVALLGVLGARRRAR
jgi:hypothetical protein